MILKVIDNLYGWLS